VNLKTRFTMLIVGVIVIPLIVMGLSFAILNNYMSVSDPGHVAAQFNYRLDEVKVADDLKSLSEDFGNSYFALMVEEPELLASSDAGLLNYNRLPRDGDTAPRLIIQSKMHTLEDGKDVLIIFGMNLFDVNGRIFPLILIISTLSVLIILSILIIRSINSSIRKLEKATGQIAQGDLDFELETKGNDSFGSLAKSLDSMRHQIKMEYDRRNRFFMGISHDLKTPLSSITGYADALCEGMANDTATMQKYLGIIKSKSHQLEQRISHLIHYIKLSNYDFQTSLIEKPLSAYLSDFLGVQEEDWGFHNKTLTWSVKIPENLCIPYDEELLGRALENLLQNAYKYGNIEKAVQVHCRKLTDCIEIDVKNEGEKIPEEISSHLFEPFFRGDKSRKGDGFGLGLASVKSIVESHGWSITVHSNSENTIFTIIIPLNNYQIR